MTYQEIKNLEPEMWECFFAFSKTQLEEGIIKAGLESKKIYKAPMGLFGTMEGIEKFMKFYDDQIEQISKECDPQQVYDHEFWNHECSYCNDDREAIEIVIAYFGKERAQTVIRKCVCVSIESLNH
ncbi:MAG TPA: hypothetical protein DCL77_14280 [Prolixibacteraceae bacterium]|jgi:hypothetical protein|nr:hypothetical protein [Prolixibacteraceae bacterium]